MPGLTRFDFYPSDWLADTYGLSDRALGLYINILALMYKHGGPLRYDEQELCRMVGCYRNVRSLRAVLPELLDKGKLHIIDGMLVNHRAMEEIEKANAVIERGRMGGKASHQTGTKTEASAESARNQRDIGAISAPYHAENGSGFVENQALNLKLPSPSPSKCSVPTERAPPPAAPPCGAQEIFDRGVRMLVDTGTPERQARGVIGRWRKQHGTEAVRLALDDAAHASPTAPIAWITAALKRQTDRAPPDDRAAYDAVIAKWSAEWDRLDAIEQAAGGTVH